MAVPVGAVCDYALEERWGQAAPRRFGAQQLGNAKTILQQRDGRAIVQKRPHGSERGKGVLGLARDHEMVDGAARLLKIARAHCCREICREWRRLRAMHGVKGGLRS